ncbi:MAG: Alkylated DNA repair protein [Algoriphagus marincola HL-49]|uniref:Alkylated DNA repair protein n=1 Tax=Algoriphagus marincola HL-49 TaxID=1305737 RepID=A0A0N8KH92_9BACT|nr:MAG: Alkylated DNA repair protein [Algoriphagus marincola HL-49]
MMANLFPLDTKNLLPHSGEVLYVDSLFELKKADKYFKILRDDISWKQEAIWMFGKKVMQPRLTALYGDEGISYSYSGITMEPIPWSKTLLEIKGKVEELAEARFSHVLLNFYRDGQDSMGWHRDNEASLGPEPVIASVSFGVPRRFQFRNYVDKKEKLQIELGHGSLLLMKGTCQDHWEHQIPKSKKVSGERINLTFRLIR